MKCDVKLYVAGKVFTETVHARDYQEARGVALARNPNARVIGVNANYKDGNCYTGNGCSSYTRGGS